MINEDTTQSILNPGEPLREIRSHRREPDWHYRKPLLTLSALVLCSPLLVASVLPTSGTPAHQYTPPASVPLAGPVKAPVALEAAQPQQPTNPTTEGSQPRSDRASRNETRKPADPPKVEVVIAFAVSQQGKVYRFGTAGPNSFDCSGLVKAAFARIGIELYHFTGRMMGYGKRVERSALQRGDIVFPSSGHVGIYLGNNMFIHASSGKGRVAVTALYSFYTARRLT